MLCLLRCLNPSKPLISGVRRIRVSYECTCTQHVSPAFHCGGNARGNARVIKRTRPVPDSCVSMEAFSARVSAPVFDDLCVHLDLPRVYKCEMVSFQLMLTFTSGNSDIVSKFFSACGNARVETLQWKRFYVFLC